MYFYATMLVFVPWKYLFLLLDLLMCYWINCRILFFNFQSSYLSTNIIFFHHSSDTRNYFICSFHCTWGLLLKFPSHILDSVMKTYLSSSHPNYDNLSLLWHFNGICLSLLGKKWTQSTTKLVKCILTNECLFLIIGSNTDKIWL